MARDPRHDVLFEPVRIGLVTAPTVSMQCLMPQALRR